MFGNTIIALSTAYAQSALAILRMSGEESLSILNQVFSRPIKVEDSHRMQYGFIKDPNHHTFVDEVMCVYFQGPKSFTGEDMVEIYCHGGIIIIQELLALFTSLGAVLAKPGEFSERAYFNGKMDLLKAESINDMISAESEEAKQLAMLGLRGEVSKVVESLKDDLIDIIAKIEVNIDYPEYDDVEVLTTEIIQPRIERLMKQMDTTLQDAKRGNIIKDGIQTAIIGKPNVGKSSLLNALLNEQKAIVTDIPGTTRDIVEGRINLNGVILHLLDTAGIHESEDVVERIGIERSKETMKQASLVLLVLDASKPLTEEDQQLLDFSKNLNRILVYNKQDALKTPRQDGGVYISAKLQQIDDLKQAILDHVGFEPARYKNKPMLSSMRHVLLMKQALKSLQDAYQSCLTLQPVDLVEIDLKESLKAIGELLGEESGMDVSKEIFSRFCLGK